MRKQTQEEREEVQFNSWEGYPYLQQLCSVMILQPSQITIKTTGQNLEKYNKVVKLFKGIHNK